MKKTTFTLKAELLKKIETIAAEHNGNDELVDVSGTRTAEDMINLFLENAVYFREREKESEKILKSLGLRISDNTCIHCSCGLSWKVNPTVDSLEHHLCPNGCNESVRPTLLQLMYIEEAYL